MRFGWVRATATTVVLGSVLTLGACTRTPEAPAVDTAEAVKAAADFMATNGKAEGVVTLPSGLQYKVLKSGPSGSASPDSNDLVRVHYEGALIDGEVFDSSFARGQPYVTSPDQVVPGWTEGLQRMKVGDEWMLYVPPALGYGEQDKGEIPPNSVLVFRVQMLDVAPVPGGTTGVGQATG